MTDPVWHPDGVTFSPCSGNSHPSLSSQLLPAPHSPDCHGKNLGSALSSCLHMTCTKALSGMSAGRNLGAFPVQGNPALLKGCQRQPATSSMVSPQGTLCHVPPREFGWGGNQGRNLIFCFPLGKCLHPGRLWNRVREVSGGLGTSYHCLPRGAAQQEWGAGTQPCFLMELDHSVPVLLSLQMEANLEIVCDPAGFSSGKLLLQTGDLDALALRITPCLCPKSFPPHFCHGSPIRSFCGTDLFCC